MKTVTPGTMIRLWICYQENGNTITDLTDLTVIGYDTQENTVLPQQTLTEYNNTGYYFYDWDTSGIGSEETIKVFFEKNDSLLVVEEYYFDFLDDGDAQAF